MGVFFLVVEWVGIFVSPYVYARRAGLLDAKRSTNCTWGQLLKSNPYWLAVAIPKCLWWEVPAVIQLVRSWQAKGWYPSPWCIVPTTDGATTPKILRSSDPGAARQ